MMFPCRLRSHLVIVLLAAACTLWSCARTGPPAPVVSGPGQAPRSSPPAAGTAHPATPHPDQVTVQSGETLYGIARRYDVPVRSVIEANQLAPPYKLLAGRTLILPQVRQHVVQSGETLYTVSRRYGVDASTLARANQLAPPYNLRVGEALILPAPVQAVAAAPAGPQPPAASPTVTQIPLPPPPPIREAAPAEAPAPVRPAEAAVPPPALPDPPPAKPPVAEETPAVAPPAAQTAALPPPPPASGAYPFIWPVRGRVITEYGPAEGGAHNDGINIAAAAGTPVVAADAGVVAYAGNELRGYGNLILVKHAGGWMTAYAHNSALLVKRGDTVKRGQAIARVGATGAVGEPQLHFEIRKGTRALDPGEYLPPATTTTNS